MGKEHFYEKVSAFLRFAGFSRRIADGLCPVSYTHLSEERKKLMAMYGAVLHLVSRKEGGFNAALQLSLIHI